MDESSESDSSGRESISTTFIVSDEWDIEHPSSFVRKPHLTRFLVRPIPLSYLILRACLVSSTLFNLM